VRQRREHGVLRHLLRQHLLRLQEANQQAVRGRLLCGEMRMKKIERMN
jgi:hypothetical protein